MVAVDHVFTNAQTLLSTVVDIYDDADKSLPSRQYVADGGEVALDCELVAVALARVYRGTPNLAVEPLRPQRCVGIHSAEYHIWIVRCSSTPQESGDPPSTISIESFALPLYTDAWLLPSGLQAAAIGGDLGLSCDEILIGNLEVKGPAGGYVGVDLTITYQLGE